MRYLVAATAIVAIAITSVGSTACVKRQSVQPPVIDGPATPTVAPSLDVSAPDAAVRSYLDWVTIAYRMANSEAASQTHTEAEGVRVDAYIQLNREQGQGLAQKLDRLEIAGMQTEDATATVSALEAWSYRYFDLKTIRYVGPSEQASYAATYTVLRQPDGRWLVDSVDATTIPGWE